MTDHLTDVDDIGLILPEEDGLFSRDIDGQLVRMDKVTAADFDRRVTIRIDGREVTVPKAVPLTDAQGKILRDQEGRPLPRATTIFDAATRAYGDLLQMGVVDPVKVTRLALQNAGSIAALVLTTDCLIAQAPEPKRDSRAGESAEMPAF